MQVTFKYWLIVIISGAIMKKAFTALFLLLLTANATANSSHLQNGILRIETHVTGDEGPEETESVKVNQTLFIDAICRHSTDAVSLSIFPEDASDSVVETSFGCGGGPWQGDFDSDGIYVIKASMELVDPAANCNPCSMNKNIVVVPESNPLMISEKPLIAVLCLLALSFIFHKKSKAR